MDDVAISGLLILFYATNMASAICALFHELRRIFVFIFSFFSMFQFTVLAAKDEFFFAFATGGGVRRNLCIMQNKQTSL